MQVLRRILLVIGSALFTALLCEIGLRILIHFDAIDYPNPDLTVVGHQYAANEDLVYELRPNWTSYDGSVTINKWGMRDYEYSLAKPGDVQRIAVVGDSVAFGYGEGVGNIPLEDTFAKLLEAKINAHSPHKFEVLNFSVSGYNSFQEQVLVESKVLGFDPDVILVCYVPNDDTYADGLGQLAREMSPHSLGSKLNSKLISYVLFLYERIWLAKTHDITIVWDFFDRLQSLGEEREFEVVILMTPYEKTLSSYDQKHELVKEKAESYGFGVVDPKESWKHKGPEFRNALYDLTGTHYTAVGMREVADMLFDYFTRSDAPDTGEDDL